jgi:hypothetical protein
LRKSPTHVETEYTLGQLHECTQGSPAEIQTPSQWNLIGCSACVIAQQYSTAIFVSLSADRVLKIVIEYFFTFFKNYVT